MLEDAFKMMGEEKDGVIRVHKEAERKLKLMQQEYEVPFSNWKKNLLTYMFSAQVLREEKEKLVRRDKSLAVKFKQFQEEMARLQVIGGEALFAKSGSGLALSTLLTILSIITSPQEERQQVGGRGDELDWESCLLSNQLDDKS